MKKEFDCFILAYNSYNGGIWSFEKYKYLNPYGNSFPREPIIAIFKIKLK